MWHSIVVPHCSGHMAPAAALSKSFVGLRKRPVMERVLSFLDPDVIAPYRSRKTAIDVWKFLYIRELWSQIPIFIGRTDVDKYIMGIILFKAHPCRHWLDGRCRMYDPLDCKRSHHPLVPEARVIVSHFHWHVSKFCTTWFKRELVQSWLQV